MDRFQVPLLAKFNFSRPEEWPKWIYRFERFRIASGLELQSEGNQVNTLIYTVEEEVEDILTPLRLTPEEASEYSSVRAKLEAHLVGGRNVIFERTKFNQTHQEVGESAEGITAVHCLGHCLVK